MLGGKEMKGKTDRNKRWLKTHENMHSVKEGKCYGEASCRVLTVSIMALLVHEVSSSSTG